MVSTLSRVVQALRDLATISGEWYWQQDAQHRLSEPFGLSSDRESTRGLEREVIGRCRWELPESVALSIPWEEHRAILNAHEPFKGFEYQCLSLDGQNCRYTVTGVPLFDELQNFIGYLGTSRKLAGEPSVQKLLRQSEKRFESLTRLSADWYWETDPEFRFTVLSGGLTEQARSAIGEHLGKTRWEIDASPKNAALWAGHQEELERHATFRNFEYVREDPHGEQVALSISGEPMYGDDGEFNGYRGVGTDITARKKSEAALRLSESRLQAVFGALAEGVVVRDLEQKIVDCNASAERMFGKTLEQVRGQTLMAPEWAALHEDGSPMLPEERPGARAVRTGRPIHNEVVCHRRADGSLMWNSVNVQPIFANDEPEATRRPTGYVVSMIDISKRKLAEMEIARLNSNLENRVRQRTQELEAANKELEAFSYSVAHDLRSPLITIDGYCSMLEKAVSLESSPRGRSSLERIRGGVRRMGELTDGLLTLARLSRSDIRWEKVDLGAEALKILKQNSARQPGRSTHFEVEQDIEAVGDPSLLREILENLIGNAWKFTSKNANPLISVGRSLGPDGAPIYYVRDNGAGFDMAYADKLFIPFQRLHSVEEFPGSGIGLATVSRIVARHGGKIWAESSLGEGTTFFFTLGAEQHLGSK